MRAADEVHTSVWSCGMCPLDPTRISFGRPRPCTIDSYPRKLRTRVPSGSKCASRRSTGAYSFLEVSLPQAPQLAVLLGTSRNDRRPCSVPDGKNSCLSRAFFHQSGPCPGEIVKEVSTEPLSPICSVRRVSRYNVEEESALGQWESDGTVSTLSLLHGSTIYYYKRAEGDRTVHIVVVPINCKGWKHVMKAVEVLCFAGPSWPAITGFVSRDYLATINNLSPRAWDSKRIQRRGASYTPKVDGERVYVVVFSGMMHVFAKSRGYPHIGCRALNKQLKQGYTAVVDAENTVSHGIFFIDMLTDSAGRLSPRERDYKWSVQELQKLQELSDGIPVKVKPYTHSLLEAEGLSRSALYPTDGVIALWPGTTTSRKMKLEKSIELLVGSGGSLRTSDGDEVFDYVEVPRGIGEGDIAEVRFKLCTNGRDVASKPVFRRTDKATANSTSAVMAVLSSFGSVRRDNETRRREVLMWCESLKQHLIRSALEKRGSRRVVLDIGTGTGQSLDVLSPGRGVSYLLVEPSAQRCEALKRRTGLHKVMVDPQEIMSVMRSLKSGAQTYAIANMGLSQIALNEELMKFIGVEVAFVSATFSAHFVAAELYDICSYWQLPMVGCMYAYDEVDIGGYLVHTLGVSMRRVSETECMVKWGGDQEYTEPYTTTQEYHSFCTVARAIDTIPPPNRESDGDAWGICSKVYTIENFQES